MESQTSLGIVGFGEVGFYTAKGLKESGFGDICAYNSGERNRPPYTQAYRDRADGIGVTLVDSIPEMAARAQTIFSATSPATAAQVAQVVAPHLGPPHLYVDMNSCGPRAKLEAAKSITTTGADFVDACLMSSPFTSLHRGLTYVSGPRAEEVRRQFAPYGMDIEVIPDGKVGDAALLKMLRSILTKGSMTIFWELSYAAYKCGVDLRQFERALGVGRGDFFAGADRTVAHGYIHARRRAEEAHDMEETLRDYGVEPHLAEAYEKRFLWASKWEKELRREFEDKPAPSALDVVRLIDELYQRAPHELT